jgi:hypothetical protein
VPRGDIFGDGVNSPRGSKALLNQEAFASQGRPTPLSKKLCRWCMTISARTLSRT